VSDLSRQSLRVDFPPVRDASGYSTVTEPSIPPRDTFRRQPAVVGSKSLTGVQSKIKVSTVPRAFHLYIGNLDVNMESFRCFILLRRFWDQRARL
jgi:hypothetical protein